jgi:hypothetical protein
VSLPGAGFFSDVSHEMGASALAPGVIEGVADGLASSFKSVSGQCLVTLNFDL